MQFPFEVEACSVEETEKAGRDFGEYIASINDRNAFIAIYGDLGAGKTCFVRGLAHVLTPEVCISSPTYNIVNEYRGENFIICHFDMYRIESEDDLYSIGFYDYDNCIKAVEWSEKIPFALPDTYYKLEILKTAENNGRIIKIECCS